MKILQINAVYNIGSTGRNTTELHYALLQREFESYVACSMSGSANEDRLFMIGDKKDRKIHALLSRLSGKQAYFSKNATKKLIKFMEKIKPDVVHLGNLHANFINLPLLLKYLDEKDIATVITLHDFWFMTGKCVHFIEADCYKWKTECKNCPNLQSGNSSWFFDRTKKMFNDKLSLISKIKRLAVIGVSDWVTVSAKKSPIFKNAKIIKKIYNWVDFESFRPKDISQLKDKLGITNEFVVLGVATIWDERKDLNSFVKLSEQLPENSKIVIVGSIPEGIKLPDNMIAVGRTESVEELVDYYNLADVFVTLSAEETFGKVSVESLGCGTPVVCYKATANIEVVGEGCGYLVEKGNLDGIGEAINKIYVDGKEKYSGNCINFARSNFDKKKLIDEHIALYNELCK
ncbi:MAG: glycosyltransferase [Clostridia bacterium]|nr:glycosyltransferase [Clostridia bacterium]